MSDILVVGSLNMDFIVRAPHLPAPGETLLGSSYAQAPGGKGANQAVAAVKLGAPVKLIGRVGKDELGKQLRANLNAVGVDAQFVSEDAEAPTGVALVTVDDAAQNTIVVVPGANGSLGRADVDAAANAFRSAGVVIVQLEIPLETVTYVLQRAAHLNALTILNPSPAQALSREVLSSASVIVPNETEAGQLTGIPVTDYASAQNAAAALRQMGARRIIITLGSRGALWMDEGANALELPPFQVKAIDTTAAGDAFVGALAAALSRDKDWLTALTEARGAGALASTRPGAQPALPTRAELDEFLSPLA